MVDENISQKFRLKNINQRRNYFLKEIEQNELMSIEHFLILASTVTGCISISAFSSLLGIFIGIMSSAIGLNICAITAGIKRCKSTIKKKKKSMIK